METQILNTPNMKANEGLQVSEASVSRNRSTIIVPAGSTRDEGWAAFRNILAEINEASRLFILPNQQSSEPSERLVGLSDDVGAGFISGHSTQPAPASELNVERSVELPAQDEIGNLGVSKVIRADQKRFFFDLGSNNRGHFLRISEVAGSDRSSIILPLSGLKQFHEMGCNCALFVLSSSLLSFKSENNLISVYEPRKFQGAQSCCGGERTVMNISQTVNSSVCWGNALVPKEDA
ncbi:Transcription factor Pur-alpha 1 [Vitis vinifera]|uniref:Transcription factor Pur-alpha 1 n=1 Tax=Vitis vinifera TaxID=29760 RepID=A0A438JVV2_VITVI|nr:Transcription factor Pur-alpha 1 [Vitis vinifera]